MAKVIITMQINPASPDADLNSIREFCEKQITDFGAEVGKIEEKPMAFGLKAIIFHIISDEDKGDTEQVEKKIEEREDVASVQITETKRALG